MDAAQLGYWDSTLDGSLPCLVLGWQEPPNGVQVVEATVGSSTRLAAVEHQFGGYSCRQAEFVGVLLPLAENLARLKHVDEMRKVFGVFGSDLSNKSGKAKLRSVDSDLIQWWLTSGGDFEPEDCEMWTSILRHCVSGLAKVRAGAEALVVLDDPDPSRFVGWNAGFFVGGVNGWTAEIRPFEEAEFQNLKPTHLWLVWTNSD